MSLIVANQATPTTPGSGNTELYVTSGKRAAQVDDAGLVNIFTVDISNTGAKIASGGPVALVTGTKVVATGLATVQGFVAIPSGQPTGTGAASHQILAATSITTGAVTVTAYSVSSVTGATIAANTSTGSFYWFAMGT